MVYEIYFKNNLLQLLYKYFCLNNRNKIVMGSFYPSVCFKSILFNCIKLVLFNINVPAWCRLLNVPRMTEHNTRTTHMSTVCFYLRCALLDIRRASEPEWVFAPHTSAFSPTTLHMLLNHSYLSNRCVANHSYTVSVRYRPFLDCVMLRNHVSTVRCVEQSQLRGQRQSFTTSWLHYVTQSRSHASCIVQSSAPTDVLLLYLSKTYVKLRSLLQAFQMLDYKCCYI